ncbi:SDR family NAD(P)-dependent oxidoreductase [Georgenia sp. Z1491]|uniref:SDR family NAD(P)-dependent oxidoreductase n=1 Tax=Georgenia sp. Z1491 TaxID=3416707 RepID=UPI003CED1CAD
MSYNSAHADGGVAVVSGGAAGLGRAFVRSLLRSGHDVAILDVADSPEDPRGADDSTVGRLLCHVGDATDPQVIAKFVTRVRTELGSPRVLVNNVGLSPYRAFAEETLEGWRQVMAVNVESAVLLSHALLPDLRADGAGRIVNMSSSVVWDAESRSMVAYAAAKAAIVGLTRALATELGPDGVTVNCLAPGIVLTPDVEGRQGSARLERYRERQSIKLIATADDLTSSLDFLVSRRSGHVTGVVLGINGGRVWL